MRKVIQKLKAVFFGSLSLENMHLEYSNLLDGKITKRYLVVSLDCDTPEDANAAKFIAEWFMEKNIPANFAVPGKRIEEAETVYRAIGKDGFEFINHGYLEHTSFNVQKKRYTSTTFYNEMDEDEIRQDILAGHKCILKRIGVRPSGFRAPHFGNFQKEQQLGIIYRLLSELDYSYSTTTMPEHGLRKGGIFKTEYGIFEFPLSGTFDNPTILLDSWQFLAAPERIFSEDDYVLQFTKMVDFFAKKDLPCLLNYYVDPIHVVDFQGFFACIEYALKKGMTVSTYSEIISMLNKEY